MKTNMVARTVRVTATGIQPGKAASDRELFTKEGSSLLVSENGGIVQIPALVTRGQLLLLANVEAKREVVAQVKRTYKAMNGCVELEFAEPAPRFWGTEFSAATALLPKAAKDTEAVARIFSEEPPEESAEAPPLPTPTEVELFKWDVDVLTGKAQPPQESSPTEDHSIPKKSKASEPDPLPKPSPDLSGFTVPLPKAPGFFHAKGSFTPGAKLRLLGITAVLVVIASAAVWYRHHTWKSAEKEAPAFVPAVSANVTTSPTVRRGATGTKSSDTTGASGVAVSPMVLAQPDEPARQPFAPNGSKARPDLKNASVKTAGVKRTSPSATVATKAAIAKTPVRPPAQTVSDLAVAFPTGGVVVPPKLIKSVQAVATMENVRDFESGSVVLDAVVGTEGEVHLITVVSGPPSLRAPAIEAAKQYRYEPATRNGQPVPEHVHITIRFRFES